MRRADTGSHGGTHAGAMRTDVDANHTRIHARTQAVTFISSMRGRCFVDVWTYLAVFRRIPRIWTACIVSMCLIQQMTAS